MTAELLDHGQELTLRTRRGADFVFTLTLTDDSDVPIDITGATVIGRVFAPGQADVQLSTGSSVDGPAGQITIRVAATQTKQMVQDWQYTLGYLLGGVRKALLFGKFFVSQEFV
jgi:hypothetical protein